MTESPKSSERIRQLAWLGQAMCAVSMLIIVGNPVLALLDTAWRDHMLFGGMSVNGGPPLPIAEGARNGIVLLSVPLVLCFAFALWSGFQLFAGYRRGEIFTQSAATHLTRIGYAILALSPIQLATKVVLGRILEQGAATGGAAISMPLSIEDFDFGNIAFGLIAIIIGRILGEAAKLSEENRMFV